MTQISSSISFTGEFATAYFLDSLYVVDIQSIKATKGILLRRSLKYQYGL